MTISIGIIGGTGFYQLSNEAIQKKVKTPFGKAIISISEIGAKKIAFITRHNEEHKIPPHLVNYRANIYALYSLGISKIISTSAVGSLDENLKPGYFVLPDQFIDFTIGRPKTFFDGKFSVRLSNGQLRNGVVHIDVSDPYCPVLRQVLLKNIQESKSPYHEGGTYVCTEGPRFETPAEINAFRKMGGTLVGMTSVSECILARELNICYATLCIVTNLAAGMQERITIEEVIKIFNEKISDVKQIISCSIKNLDESEPCNCKI